MWGLNRVGEAGLRVILGLAMKTMRWGIVRVMMVGMGCELVDGVFGW